MQQRKYIRQGFTLIEASIVLVILALIIGSVFLGKSLKNSAAINAQIAQIQKYQAAVNMFQTKYNSYLPGDIPSPYAQNFGFQTRGQKRGEGDGNGLIESNCSNCTGCADPTQGGCGEMAVFWQDLSTAGLIDTSVPTGTNQPNISAPITGNCCASVPASPGLLTQWIPQAKLGNNNFIYAYTGAIDYNSGASFTYLNANYFGLSQVSVIGWNYESTGNSGSGAQTMTVQQAYAIDSKMDDGLPQSGNVIACYLDYDANNEGEVWAAGFSQLGAGSSVTGGGFGCVPTTSATSYASSNCFDNNGVTGVQTYSLSKNAATPNCALSFQIQNQ